MGCRNVLKAARMAINSFLQEKLSWHEEREEWWVFGCGEPCGDRYPLRGRVVSAGCIPVAAQRFPSPKAAAAASCSQSGNWERMSREQGKKVLSPEGVRFNTWAVAHCLLSDLCQQKWWRRLCCIRAGSQAQGEGPAVLLSICKGRGSLETALTSQSGPVAF